MAILLSRCKALTNCSSTLIKHSWLRNLTVTSSLNSSEVPTSPKKAKSNDNGGKKTSPGQDKQKERVTSDLKSTGQAKPNNPMSSVAEPKVPSIHVFRQISGKIGPNASKEGQYKNPEYYCYHRLSYNDMEIEMKDKRLKQPSSLG